MTGISDTFHSAVGSAKKGLGKAVGSEQLIAEGAAEKAKAETRAATGSAQQQAQGGVSDGIAGRAKSPVDAATGSTAAEAQCHMQETAGDVRRAVN
ncbi:hypothetical protein BCR41DRAFT_420316 [Lobosporangium transversale]|uniref:CsbD-like domain-containing protein n=1 Tax=Lobosporangium transversale TaxID=64571 RepID=A0A1Y2GYA5_9FUNG|nr:hypothetical protein BCR41DRAFT_420316 [Lobosporangium transversale]ORZ23753.1 hypothetical protein BCR41DRAFT_420316 [Lobosporangium transversale]|eukprot:XP_021883567.1 hypothetical protein BCR41DRAFT_420316 [Lobosporangium transversale]